MIGDRPVGPDHPPMVIAEMSGNHNRVLIGPLNWWMQPEAGAHALKLQTYTADTITLRQRGGDFQINDEGALGWPKPPRFVHQGSHSGSGISQSWSARQARACSASVHRLMKPQLIF